MIQRIQTIFLFISAIICFLFLFIPIGEIDTIMLIVKDISISTIITIASGILSIFALFLFKNRKLQIRICLINIALLFMNISYIYFYFTEINTEHSISPLIMTPLAAILFLLLALRTIKKDEELVRSADRIR